MTKIKRSYTTEFRTEEGSRYVEGYALKFEEASKDLGGFVEIISRGALDGVLENSDVLCVVNHNDVPVPMARYRGENVRGERTKPNTLELVVDEVGLWYRFEVPSANQDLLDAMLRGDIDASSFAFTVKKSDVEVTRNDAGQIVKRINKFAKIYDVSPVSRPAYEATEVGVRSEDEAIKEFESMETEQQKRQEIIDNFNKRSWAVTNTVDGLTTGKSSREIKNGFIVTTEVWGYDKEGKWIWEYSEEYFETDPLTGESASEDQAAKAAEIEAYYKQIDEQLKGLRA
jgi:HK97 family phage prohead protease